MVLKVGAEGGSLTIYGLRSPQGWRFSRQSIDDSAAFLGELREQRDSEIVESWEEALKLLKPYPWQKLYPLEVHPADSSGQRNRGWCREDVIRCGIVDAFSRT
jgi:hypothetical protein